MIMNGSPDEGPLIDAVRPAAQPPGRGVLVDRRRGARLVQLAWPPDRRAGTVTGVPTRIAVQVGAHTVRVAAATADADPWLAAECPSGPDVAPVLVELFGSVLPELVVVHPACWPAARVAAVGCRSWPGWPGGSAPCRCRLPRPEQARARCSTSGTPGPR